MTATRALGWLSLAALAIGIGWGLGLAPREETQGNVQRIMYVHVPSAIVAEYIACPLIFFASVGYLWKRRAEADRLAHASAEAGVVFMALTIITGSIWG
ncbi:MAG: hypothetical protein DMD81_07245, partial [Candidatus Rokuibacteriota bacterium]